MKISMLICLLVVEFAYSQQFEYPLHVGDVWEYGDGIRDRVTITGDSLMSNGKRYMVRNGINVSWDKYQRKSGDSVYSFDVNSQQEHVLYDFSSTDPRIISTFASSPGETTDIYLTFVATDTLFGSKRSHWYFNIDRLRHFADDEESQRITDSLGLSARSGFIYFSLLTGALIDGVKYGTITHISSIQQGFPLSFSLSQNYPNPFNPTTTILYELPEQSLVTIKVFNILGQQKAILVDGRQETGAHFTQLDASAFTSGLYYYELTAICSNRTIVESKRMLLVR